MQKIPSFGFKQQVRRIYLHYLRQEKANIHHIYNALVSYDKKSSVEKWGICCEQAIYKRRNINKSVLVVYREL